MFSIPDLFEKIFKVDPCLQSISMYFGIMGDY